MNKISGYRVKTFFQAGLIYLILVPFSLAILYPLYWQLINSFKYNPEMFQDPWGLPKVFHWENYTEAIRIAKLGLGIRNSSMMTIVSVSVLVTVSMMASYIFARFLTKFNNLIFSILILGLVVPAHAVVVPLFVQMTNLGMVDSLFGVSLINAAFSISFVTYVLVNHIRTIPKDMDEAARIDGCSTVGIFFNVIIPLSASMIFVIIILQTIGIWNEYLFSVIFISRNMYKTLPLLLTSFKGQHSSNMAYTFAAIFISMIPMLVFYMVFQRRILGGVALGAVKG
jgi:raffinose/stachyose/melibiose transport system permease protein